MSVIPSLYLVPGNRWAALRQGFRPERKKKLASNSVEHFRKNTGFFVYWMYL